MLPIKLDLKMVVFQDKKLEIIVKKWYNYFIY